MEMKIKESISRILLMVFFAMLFISSTFLATAGTMIIFYALLGFLPIIILLLGFLKHRIYVCMGLFLILILIMVNYNAVQKLYENRISFYFKQMEELKQKLEKYEYQDSSVKTDARPQ